MKDKRLKSPNNKKQQKHETYMTSVATNPQELACSTVDIN